MHVLNVRSSYETGALLNDDHNIPTIPKQPSEVFPKKKPFLTVLRFFS